MTGGDRGVRGLRPDNGLTRWNQSEGAAWEGGRTKLDEVYTSLTQQMMSDLR